MKRPARNASQRVKGCDSTTHLVSVHKRIDSIAAMGFHHHDIVRDWIELMFCAFIARGDPESPYETEYLATLERYGRHKQAAAQEFALMLADLMRHMLENNLEGISGIWECFCANANTGQFFTPWSLCVAMAKLHEMDQIDFGQYSEERPCRINDPACGAGLTLMAASAEISPENLCKCEFVGQDVDVNCCRMTALNMLFFNMPGYVVLGDTLAAESWKVWRVHHSLAFGGSLAEVNITAEPKQNPEPVPVEPTPRLIVVREQEELAQGCLF